MIEKDQSPEKDSEEPQPDTEPPADELPIDQPNPNIPTLKPVPLTEGYDPSTLKNKSSQKQSDDK